MHSDLPQLQMNPPPVVMCHAYTQKAELQTAQHFCLMMGLPFRLISFYAHHQLIYFLPFIAQ